MAETTFYPDPHVESTSVDGTVVTNLSISSGETWATITGRSAGTAAVDDSTNGFDTYVIHDTTTDRWRYLGRSFFLFDTSSVADTDVVDSAIFSMYIVGKDDSPAQTYSLVDCNPASDTALVTGDYDQVGSTLLASEIAGSAISTSAYVDFTLNASGEANIDFTGLSKFATRLKDDLDGTAPTWSSGAAAGLNTRYADQTGTSEDPKLVVTHSEGSAFVPKVMMY